MTTPEAQEAAAKQRIIKHMNADHHDSIRRYVEAYASKTIVQSRNAQMTDIDLGQMKFSCGNQQAVVAFDPPMKSLREARERLVQMDKDTLQALGRSDISIQEYIPPTAKLGHLLNFTQCLLAYLLLPRPANFRPGSLLYDTVLFRYPPFANFNAQFGWIVFAVMLPIHLFETHLMVKKLTRHGRGLADGVWWKWVGSTFVEGVTAFWRLDGLIEEKRREKDAKKH
ncbi:integral membrane protein-like protein [Pyrenochaeta sp. MPI-SDFR-AT-0127]|nr:integral membrane protein-like protein [Pyrenochaeta sp. MPI-SDFR-AT-0127]